MVLDNKTLNKIFRERPNKKMLHEACEYTKKLMMHMKGLNCKEYMDNLGYFENPNARKVREQYLKGNKDMFTRIHRPIDKVFSARGGSVYYNLPESKEKQLIQAISEVQHGYSLRKWVENFWLNGYEFDPMGMVFMEINEYGKVYPTYKSVLDVYEYQLNGRKFDYVIFKTDIKIERYKKENKEYLPIYRVVDDIADKLVAWDGTSVKIVPNETYPNYWGEVPALVNSDIYDQLKGMFISPDDSIINVADEYMQEGSYFNIFKKYHFFPKAWQYQRKCMPCEGTGKQDGKDCPRCLGSGLAPDWKVSETVLVPTPIDKDQPTLAPGAGYVTPDIDGWQAMKESLEGLEELMFKTMWGTEMETDGTNETATGRFIDTQPVNERLNKYADAAEVVEEYIINMIGKILFNGYDGCDVHYGRRFLIENPDEIWNKYLDARVKGAPISTLDELLKEYYIYKYANDSWELQRYLKLMAVEPFVHYTATQVLSLRVSETDYLKKIYFNEWLTTLQVNDIVLRSLDDLRASLEEYALTKELMRVSKNSISL